MSLIINPGAFVEHEYKGETRVILRGDLDLVSSLGFLKWDWYQRKQGFSPAKLKQLTNKFAAGAEFPDIILGMRGHAYAANENKVTLKDPVYVIDGLQRWTAAMIVHDETPAIPVRLGAKIYFDTDIDFERIMFRDLNTHQTAMSANVILRNEKEVNRLAGSLYGLSMTNAQFALYRRVCWDQAATKGVSGDLVGGMTLLNVVVQLHAHIIGAFSATVLDKLQETDQRMLANKLGLQQVRDNLVSFFDFVDNAWGIRRPGLVKTNAPHLQNGWLLTVAAILSDHEVFWRDQQQLFISLPYQRDFKKIDPFDLELRRLAGGNTSGRQVLYSHILTALNKGTRTNRLVARQAKSQTKAAS